MADTLGLRRSMLAGLALVTLAGGAGALVQPGPHALALLLVLRALEGVGFLLAVMGIQLRFPDNSNFVTWMVPVFLFGLPIFDMTLVVFSRLRRGLSPSTAGQDHTSHRLVNLGFSSREAVLILYLFSGMLGMMALFITQATIVEGYVVGGFTALLGVVALAWLEMKWKEREAV